MDLFLTMDVNFCTETANLWQIVGWVLLVFKIIIPILLIVFGMLDLGKAVVASKDDEIKKAGKSLGFRAASAIVIFLIPTIIGFIMGFVSDFKSSGAKTDFDICQKCIVRPNGNACINAANAAWGKTTGDVTGEVDTGN